jgi:hypothetical protein
VVKVLRKVRLVWLVLETLVSCLSQVCCFLCMLVRVQDDTSPARISALVTSSQAAQNVARATVHGTSPARISALATSSNRLNAAVTSSDDTSSTRTNALATSSNCIGDVVQLGNVLGLLLICLFFFSAVGKASFSQTRQGLRLGNTANFHTYADSAHTIFQVRHATRMQIQVFL